MVTPNRQKLSCLVLLVSSSVLVPCLVYLLYTSDFLPFPGYDFKKIHYEDKSKVVLNEETFWSVQDEKRIQLQHQCLQYQLDQVTIDMLPTKTLSSIIVDDRHQVLYCQIPKVACTNWRRVFLILSGKLNITNPLEILSDDAHHKYKNNLRYLSQYGLGEIRYRLKNYFKFMIAREPLERVLSAYRNKFIMKFSSTFQRLYGRKIIKRYRRNATEQAKEEGDDVSFAEFVQYLLDPRTVMEQPLNEHWIQQHKHCFPCTVNYDVIGHYENLDSDATHILHYMNVDKNVTFPSRYSTYSHSKTSESLKKYFKQVPLPMLRDLYEMYYLDYMIFGYPYPDFLKVLNPSVTRQAGIIHHQINPSHKPRP
ncbi:carbohydrate sulfotransferase 11-like isoform X2 [Liolophura sinensis]|uniref:carbohydrate sulfotransferase 11-like isoform X2 n=1 Tax=Liolophura sinensis TaxID=3198878 RepID=UPI0031592729